MTTAGYQRRLGWEELQARAYRAAAGPLPADTARAVDRISSGAWRLHPAAISGYFKLYGDLVRSLPAERDPAAALKGLERLYQEMGWVFRECMEGANSVFSGVA